MCILCLYVKQSILSGSNNASIGAAIRFHALSSNQYVCIGVLYNIILMHSVFIYVFTRSFKYKKNHTSRDILELTIISMYHYHMCIRIFKMKKVV